MPERYEFIRKIAQGGFGRVYVAKDTRLGREVAIKRLLSPEESSAYEAAHATFEREATTLAAMQHPNIVQIFDFDKDEEGTYVVMEMLDGETLKDRLNRGPLTWDTFVSVTRQVLDAINAAHLKGILHRDLKPENLFLHRTASGTRVLKVLDFGLAKLSNVPSRQTMDQSGNVFGSIYYMAPEQFMREPLDGRTDLYALGCVFYQALTSKFPFHGSNMQGTMEAHMKHEVTPIREKRPDLSLHVGDWLMRLISFHPDDRPQDAMTALKEFEAALEGRTLAPAPKVPSATVSARSGPPSSRPARMNPATSTSTSRRPGTPPTSKPSGPATSRPSGPAPESGAAKAPMQSRPISALEASRAEARAKLEASAKRKKLALMIGIPVAIVILLIVALVRPGSDGKPPEKTATSATSGKGKATPPPKPKAPATPPLPDAAPLSLPLEGSLAWRFRAGMESRHKGSDGKLVSGKLYRGQTVELWRNLASPERLGLQPYEGKPERAPTGQFADIKGPGTSHPYLHFPVGSGMEMKLRSSEAAQAPGVATLGPLGVTVAAVFRANAGSKEPVMRPLLLTSANGKQAFSLHFSHRVGQYWAFAERDGQTTQSLVRPEEFAKRKDGAGGNWVAAIAAWDAQQGTVSLRVQSPDGKIVTGPVATLPPGMAGLDRIHLGMVNVPQGSKLNPKEKFDGDILEVAVYRFALDVATQERVLDALWDRYFKKKA